MAFADPQSIKFGSATAISLPRTSTGVNSSTYKAGDDSVVLTVTNTYGRRNRSTLRVDHAKIAPDQFTSVNTKQSMSAYLVIDRPPQGYSLAEAKEIVDGFISYLSSSTGASLTKALGGEN
jgi:hypothetical protein